MHTSPFSLEKHFPQQKQQQQQQQQPVNIAEQIKSD